MDHQFFSPMNYSPVFINELFRPNGVTSECLMLICMRVARVDCVRVHFIPFRPSPLMVCLGSAVVYVHMATGRLTFEFWLYGGDSATLSDPLVWSPWANHINNNNRNPHTYLYNLGRQYKSYYKYTFAFCAKFKLYLTYTFQEGTSQ